MTSTPVGIGGATPTSGPTLSAGSGTSTLVTTAPNSVVSTVTDLASRAVTSGGNIYTPSIGGQIVTGPSFDINILDTQAFYQGVLNEIPFSTVDLFLDQGYDNELLMRLLVERLEFRLKAKVDGYDHPVGFPVEVVHNYASRYDLTTSAEEPKDFHDRVQALLSKLNKNTESLQSHAQKRPRESLDEFAAREEPSDPDAIKSAKMERRDITSKIANLEAEREADDEAKYFADRVACLSIEGQTARSRSKPLAPLSRVTTSPNGTTIPLRVEDLVSFDGTELDIDKAITKDAASDSDVMIVRPVIDKRIAHLEVRDACEYPLSVAEASTETLPQIPPNVYVSADPNSKAGESGLIVNYDYDDEAGNKFTLPVEVTAYYRSPEGVIKFLGEYLHAVDTDPSRAYRVDGFPLFSVKRGSSGSAVARTKVNGKDYYIDAAGDEMSRRNSQILGLVEELVNLQKAAVDHPSTVPVQVVP